MKESEAHRKRGEGGIMSRSPIVLMDDFAIMCEAEGPQGIEDRPLMLRTATPCIEIVDTQPPLA